MYKHPLSTAFWRKGTCPGPEGAWTGMYYIAKQSSPAFFETYKMLVSPADSASIHLINFSEQLNSPLLAC